MPADASPSRDSPAVPATPDNENEDPITLTPAPPSARLLTWYGSIPVEIHYGNDTISFDVPRMSYFPLTFPKLREYFNLPTSTYLDLSTYPPPADTTCITGPHDHERPILHCRLPAGLLYDLHADSSLPWRIHLISRSTPPSLSRYRTPQSSSDLKTHLWNSLKQNQCLRVSSIRALQNLTPVQSENLVSSMLSLDFRGYLEATESFMDVKKLKHVPVRVYLSHAALECDEARETRGSDGVEEVERGGGQRGKSGGGGGGGGYTVIQPLIAPLSHSDTRVSCSSPTLSPATTTRATGQKTKDLSISDILQSTIPLLASLGPSIIDVIVQGARVGDWMMDVCEVLRCASSVDGWLDVVVKLAERSECAERKESQVI